MTITQSYTRLVAIVAGVVLASALLFGASMQARAASLTPSQVSAIISLLQSFGADQATINNVQASLTGQPTTSVPSTTGGSCTTQFTRNLTVGSTGADVKALQQFLNKDASTMVAATGAGSPGMETSTFGPATKAAVMKFQTKYGISPVGNTGPMTRAKLNELCGSATPTTPTTPTTPSTTTGTSLMVAAGAQPANVVAPANSARIPFTTFTVTAGNDGDVTLNSVTVQRQGLSVDLNFTGVELLDSNGNQVGISRTLNSQHQATIGAAIVIPKGTTKTFTVAADTAGTSVVHSGEIASFAVVAVNSSATVSGSLPIVGASNTLNNTLTIGTVTAQRGANDPGVANSALAVGSKNYVFSSVRLTAGSAEQVYLKGIRFHQVGSISQSYLSNVAVLVDGVSYPATASSDNYFQANFPGQGILIDKGFSKDVAIQGNVDNGTASTVEFDVQKRNDINAVGAMYGYGILPAFGSGGTGQIQTSDDPYYLAFSHTISGGTITVSTGNASAANVAVNQQNQVLGSWNVQVQGEPVSVGKMIFNLYETGSSATWADITNVSLVNQNGAVLAGPVDATAGTVTAVNGLLTFTDTVTFPTGTTNIYLKGKLGTNFATNDTVQASTTPSTQWTSITGQTTGRSVTASPASALTSSQQTVKAVSLVMTTASVPIAQTVIAGASQFTFANYILDATASGEDVRVTTIPTAYGFTGTNTDLTNCQLYNGANSITTGSHVINPSSSVTTASQGTTNETFTIDQTPGLVVPKGTSVTLALKCDIRTGASGTYTWALGATTGYAGATGVSSGSSPAAASVGMTGAGQAMTSSTGGTLAVALDAGSPAYSVASAGSTGVDLGHLRFTATNEPIDLRQVALKLTSGSRNDLVGNQVTLWDAQTNTQVGTAVFPSGTTATSSQIVSGAFTIPSNGSRVLVIKGDLAAINVAGPITQSGDLVKVDYDGANVTGTNGTYGVGVNSTQNRQPSSASTAVQGVRVYRSFPTFTYSTTGTTLINGSNDLLTLTVAADAKGDVRLQQLVFTLATTTVTLASPTFAGPNGAVGASAPSINTAGTAITVTFDSSTNTNDRVVAAGTSKTYVLRGTVSGLTGSNSGSVSVALKADTAALVYPAAGSGLATTTGVGGVNSGNTIWSPLSTSTSLGATTDTDWTNGYGLGGCFTTVGLANDCTARVLAK